jgi:hypothetical protein
MHNQLRVAGRTRREQNPFGVVPWRAVDGGATNRRSAMDDLLDAGEARRSVLFVSDHHIDVRGRKDVRQMCGIRIRRTQHEAARDPVYFNQRESSRDLIRCQHEDRSTAKVAKPRAEGRAGRKLRECDCGITRPQLSAACECGARE